MDTRYVVRNVEFVPEFVPEFGPEFVPRRCLTRRKGTQGQQVCLGDMHTHTHTHTHIHTHTHTCVPMHARTHPRTQIGARTRIRALALSPACPRLPCGTHARWLVCMHARTHTHTHTQSDNHYVEETLDSQAPRSTLLAPELVDCGTIVRTNVRVAMSRTMACGYGVGDTVHDR